MRKTVALIGAKTLLSVMMMFAGMIAGNSLLQFIPGDQEWTLLSTPIGLSLSAWLMYTWIERKNGPTLGWRDRRWAGRLLTGGTAAAAIVSVSTLLMLVTGTVELGMNTWEWGTILFQVLLFLSVAVSEEWLFRGYLFSIYARAGGTRLAIMLNTVLFAAIHLMNPESMTRPIAHIVLEMMNILLLSILFSQARAFTGSLWLPISLHFMMNFFQSTVFGFLNGGKAVESLSRLSYGEKNIWNGAGYGLESSLILTLVLIVVVAAYGNIGSRTSRWTGSVSR